jgi:hypothetical protein
MIVHVASTSQVDLLGRRYYKQDIFGQLFFRMPKITLKHVMRVKGMPETTCTLTYHYILLFLSFH